MTGRSAAAPLTRPAVQPESLPPAVRAAHTVSVSAGRLTYWARMLPGFLIAGAQRCGTTSMYRTLSQHPAVLKAVLHKGVHYFDTGYEHSLAWYQGHFPWRARAALVRRATGETPLTFESSPYYMFHPLAAQRIRRDLPGVKLLVLVRDPAERAYSAHAHELARGYETEPFERALELEGQRLAGEAERIISQPGYLSHSHQHHAYRTRGHYADQLERLVELFGGDRVHVVDSGRFFTEPEPVYDGVLEFLGLRHGGYPVFERHNARPRSPMPETLRAELSEYFQPYDERLVRWLGGPPSWRLLPAPCGGMCAMTGPQLLPQPTARFDQGVFEARIREYARAHPGVLRILEAGCGRRWYLDLAGVDFHLAGVDLNPHAMRARIEEVGDLDEAIVGDLREVALSPEAYDVIYCSFVLEHVAGAEQVLDRLLAALKPDGMLLLRIPDGDSVYGFLARHSPYWLHVQYKRLIQRKKLAGTPGRGPFPTVYDPVVSWKGMTAYCARKGVEIVDAYSSNFHLDHFGDFARIADRGLRWVAGASGGRLTADHNNLSLVIRKRLPVA